MGERMKLKQIRLAHALGVLLLLSAVIAGPVLAQVALEHYSPREVEDWHPIQATYEATPSTTSIDRLEEMAGFSILVPTYLPPGCSLQKNSYLDKPQVIYLTYSCVVITQQKARTTQSPYIGKDSSEMITVAGNPAIYVDGAWVQIQGEKELRWAQGAAKELVFERDGLIVRLAGSSVDLSKEELIKIAESMR